MNARAIFLSVTLLTLPAVLLRPALADSQDSVKLFISVDLEGISGVGSPLMTSTGGKDYEIARQYMTREVNSVVAAILERISGADILVNDSHGDHQNLLHGELDPRVSYIQGSIRGSTLLSMGQSSSDTMPKLVIRMGSSPTPVVVPSRDCGSMVWRWAKVG